MVSSLASSKCFWLTSHSDACGLWFRRIVEIEEVDAKLKPWEHKPLPDFSTVFSWPTFRPQLAGSKRRREADEFDFSGFKRIRIVSKENRVKHQILHAGHHVFPGSYSKGPRTANISHGPRIPRSNPPQHSVRQAFEAHRRQHTTGRPFPCLFPGCLKRFPSRTVRMRHESGTHAATKPSQASKRK
jgi:hypothetical protein